MDHNTLAMITLGCLAGLVSLLLAATFKIWVKPEAWEALVITGAQPKVLINKGTPLIPILNQVCRVSLKPTQHSGLHSNLISEDRVLMDLRVAIDVVVDTNKDERIHRAAMTFGAGHFVDWDDRVRDQIEAVFTAAIREAAFGRTYEEILTKPTRFQLDVMCLVQDDYVRLGLTVLSVSILECVHVGDATEFMALNRKQA